MEFQNPIALISIVAFFFFSFDPSRLSAVSANLLPIFEGGAGMQVYIVHVQKPNGTTFHRFQDRRNWYMSFLPNTTLSSGEPRMVYTYRRVISGFAAWLTHDEAEAMEGMDGFVLSHPEAKYVVQTTYTPRFLGLGRQGGLWNDAIYGGGLTIGVIDTGVAPTHPSFGDAGMPPRPTKWKGKCYWGQPICNNKLIGATAYQHGRYPAPTDSDGHGTHTASTAGGNFVDGAHVGGYANGTASGTAPRAHLAIYKVLYPDPTKQNRSTGTDSDILKGIDEAIRDRVDILSMSLGSVSTNLHRSSVAIGSYAAITEGIFPCAAAANEGPIKSVIGNDAPWILTVGAASTDRRILSIVRLGNGREYKGESIYQPNSSTSNQLPLVFPGLASAPAEYCEQAPLRAVNITGKIVICTTGKILNSDKGKFVKKAGGAGIIVIHFGSTTTPDFYPLPASNVGLLDGLDIIDYVKTSPNPTAAITFKGTQFGNRPAPAVATFSSRGPSLKNGNIIKPDVIAPGVNIVAASPFEVGPNPTGTKKPFNFMSGTSMATPHVSGIVALLKNSHPTWSPAAIKSAIMTTAYAKDLDGKPIADEANGTASVFAMGSGHVDPVAANDPGLVYDLQPYHYVHYLCGLGYTDLQVTAITRGPVTCSTVKAITSEQLNYPSIGVYFGPRSPATMTVKRTVTNVGEANTVYTVQVDEPAGVRVDVSPTTLKFSKVGQEESFTVSLSFKGKRPATGQSAQGQLSWVSPKHLVRSPIAVLA